MEELPKKKKRMSEVKKKLPSLKETSPTNATFQTPTKVVREIFEEKRSN